MSDTELMPAIAVVERRYEDAERKANALLSALNVLREEAGLPPLTPGPGTKDGMATHGPTTIKSDSFFGKKQQTAVRELLEMRRAAGQGPAKPREIYDGLIAGGFKYGAKDVDTALVGLRAMLRKRSNVFIKVGDTKAYGLLSWYPDARKPSEDRADTTSADDLEPDLDAGKDEAETPTAATEDDESTDAAVA